MKRSLALLAAVAVVATPLAAQAAPKPPKKTTRTVSFDYQLFSAASTPVASFSLNSCDLPGQCFDFDTVKGEKTVALKAADDSGQAVAFQVFTNDDYAGNVQTFCGTGSLKVSVKSANLVSVRMAPSGACAGLPSGGTVTATITNT